MTEEPSMLPRLTLSRQIRDSLVSRIVSGQFRPGERLVETRLAATYGTSQAPVREALRELEVMRLVETQPRRGTFVRPFVHETLRESYVVRAALEETAVRLALLAGTVPVEALRSEVEAMVAAAAEGDGEASARASVSFHRHIVEAARNELLRLSWRACRSRRARRSRCSRPTSTSTTSAVTTPNCWRRSSAATWRRPASTPGTTSGTMPTSRTTPTAGSATPPPAEPPPACGPFRA
ncbi:GntR family transcriptional regulator [Streptosporangium lutulentum]